ncbi:MAG: 23S rRNA (guanosine(2251)-2'-O)-methyltransferase RlmB [Candidatus Izemoplasmataceae bacterium]
MMAIVIIGKNTVIEAINAKRKIYELYIQKGTNKDVLSLANDKHIKVKIHDKQALNQLLEGVHQGVGALVDDYAYKSLEDVLNIDKEHKFFVMLDSLEDPHNLGAILRSADAFGVDAVIIPKNRSVKLNATVAKVSTGAIEYVNVVEVTNLSQTIDKLKDNGFWVTGADASADQVIGDIDTNTSLCVVIGSEGKGMHRLVKEKCDYHVKIPMVGHINSLNASVSAGIVIYEVFKKRGI